MDQETKTILSEQEQLKKLTEHEGWQIFRRKIFEAILDLQNINNIEGDDAVKIVENMKARKMSADLIFRTLNEVVGLADQFNSNNNISKEIAGHIVQL